MPDSIQNVRIKYIVDDSDLKKAKVSTKDLVDEEAKLANEFNKVNTAANKANQTVSDGADKAGKSFSNLSSIAKSVGPAIAGAFTIGSIISFGKEVLETTAKFQKFEAVLTNTLGSNSAAQKALQMITKFAAETPFGVDELTGSFVKLVNQGFKPTQNELRKLGDLAASQGKSFDQLAEGIIDASTGEFERLKEFGIRASKEGDQVKFTFKGVQTQTDFTAESIRKYVLSLGDLKGVSGGMAAISKTLGGQISNLGDSFDALLLTVGTKLQGAFSTGISAISTAIGTLKDLIADTGKESSIFSGVMDVIKISIGNLLAPLKEFFNVLTDTFETVFKPIGNFLSAVFVPIIESFQKAFGGAGSSIGEFIAKFNPLIISLKISLIPLQLLAKALEYLTPIITEYLVPAFEKFTILLAEARNGIAEFVNGVTQSGLAKSLGLDIAKIGKVNIDELRKSFKEGAKERVEIEEIVKKTETKITEYEKLQLELREKNRKKALEERVQSDERYRELQKQGNQVTLDFHTKTEVDLTKKSKEEEEKRAKAKKASFENFKEMSKELTKQNDKDQEEQTKKVLQEEARRREIESRSFQLGADIVNGFADLQSEKRNQQLSEIEANREKELKGAGENKKAQAAINKKFDQQERDIKRKAAIEDKAAALFNIGIATAVAAIKQVAAVPLPVGAPLLALVLAQGAIQAAFVAAKPIPKFNRGTKSVPGVDTGQDSILAMLRPNEGVMPVDRMNDYRPAFDAIFDRKVPAELLNSFVMDYGRLGGMTHNSGSSSNKAMERKLDKIHDALQNIKTAEIHLDKNGVKTFLKTASGETEVLNNYFRMK
jgi:hypothetical protein